MTTRRRRGFAGLIAVTALAASSLVMGASPASADDPADGSANNPFEDLSTLPIEMIDCNVAPELIPAGTFLTFCIEMTLAGGTANFGSVHSTIGGPIKIRQVIAVVIGPGGFEDLQIVTIDENAGGGDGGGGLSFPTIDVPGGLVGQPALNQLLKPVTGVTAQIVPVGDLVLSDLNQALILEALFTGESSQTLLATANIPFKVKVNNLLLGDTCYIGSDTNPVDLHLPLNLTNTVQWSSSFLDPQPAIAFQYYVFDADATDATFDIPAADGCGLLGTGKLLDSLGGLNLFDTLVNSSVGLPAPSGTNLLSLQGKFGITFGGFDGIDHGTPAP